MAKTRSIAERMKELLAIATQARAKATHWTDLNNAVFGIGGPWGNLFPTPSERTQAAELPEYKQIREWIVELRQEHGDPAGPTDMAHCNGKISVRVPASVHAALLAEAEAEGVSLNQLCATKLTVQLAAVVGSAVRS